MKDNYEEVKISLYAGMSIFNLIKDVDINVDSFTLSIEDKKYLSLYLGIINTKNKVSNYLKNKNIKVGMFIYFSDLKQEQYLEIYNKYFVDIFKEISLESLENNFCYLLNKNIIKSFNRSNDYNIEYVSVSSNKQLVKEII